MNATIKILAQSQQGNLVNVKNSNDAFRALEASPLRFALGDESFYGWLVYRNRVDNQFQMFRPSKLGLVAFWKCS